VERIDVMAVTHADADHRGGAAAVLAAVEVGEVWVSPGFDGRARSALAARAAAAGARLRTRSAAADAYDVGDLRVRVLWPPAGPARAAPRNERSLVLAVEVAGRRLLLTGDVGRASESALLDGPAALDSDVLKVGHHGSAGGSSHRFLAAVGAEWALVSAGYPGRRGLPSPAALERLRASGARVGWTGRDGALLVGLGPELRVRAWRTGRAAQAD
jgi:competence protein ComEC